MNTGLPYGPGYYFKGLTISEIKSFDNSRPGNDCYVYEYWYWCEQLKVAIRLRKYSNDCDSQIEHSVFTRSESNDYGVPYTLRQWFQK